MFGLIIHIFKILLYMILIIIEMVAAMAFTIINHPLSGFEMLCVVTIYILTCFQWHFHRVMVEEMFVKDLTIPLNDVMYV